MRNIFLILFLLTAGVFANRTSAQAVILRSDTLEVPCISSDTFLVPVYLDNFTNVSGMQFTLQWDTARLDYAYVTMINPQFLGIGFDTSATTIALGKFTLAWTDLAGLSLPPNTILFKVAFRRIGGPPAAVSFVDDPTAVFVFNQQGDQIPSETHNGLVKPIDDQGPTITCPGFVITGGSGPTAIQNIAPTASDNCGAPAIGWSVSGATQGDFPNDSDASGALFNIGGSTVTYTATDAGGNTATCAFDIVIEFSVTATDLTLFVNPNNIATCGGTFSLDVLAFNFDTIAGLQFSMEWLPSGLEFVSITNTNASVDIVQNNFNTDSSGVGRLSFAWTTSTFPGSTLPIGATLFTLNFNVLGSSPVIFSDNPTAALAFTGTILPPEETTLKTFGANINVSDNVPPTLTCPADVTVTAPGTTPVPGIPAVVDDNCSAPAVGWSVSGATTGTFAGDPDASGGLFNLGENTVTYTATDAGGNTATCNFKVTVEFGITSTDLTIIANGGNAGCGGNFSIDVTALNFDTVAGMQFTLNWDPALYEFTSVSNFNLQIGATIGNFGVDSVGVGFITFAWTSANLAGASIANGDTLFRLNFNVLNNTSSNISFGDDPTLRIAFEGTTFAEIPMMTFDGLISVVDNDPPTIVCPDNVLQDAPPGLLFAPVSGLEPLQLTDNCGAPMLSYEQSGVTTNSGNGNANGNYNAGTTTVIYTATDANNNSATCSFQVVVDAGTPVVLQLDTVDLGCQGTLPAQVTVHLTVENFIDITGLQFGVNWDPLVLDLVLPVPIQYINTVPPPLTINQAGGTLSFFGGNPGWPDVPNDSTVLTLKFNIVDVNDINALLNTQLVFTGPFDALDPDFLSIPVQTINGAFIFNLDNVPPLVTCPSDTIVNALPQQCSASYNPVAPTTSDACGTVSNVSISPNSTVFNAGPTTLTYTATDDAGNSATCSFKVTVTESNPPQIVFCPTSPVTVNASGPFCQANAFWDMPMFKDTCGQTANLVITNDYDSGGLFSLGSTLVNYTAKDMSGNETTCSFEVLVQDVSPPTIVCPKDTVIIPNNGCMATLDYLTVVSDTCDQNLTLVCSKPSGSIFSGVTTVTCAVTDAGLNTAQCSFTVTVQDLIPPTFPNGCPANITAVSPSGSCGANPTWQAPAVMDNCDLNVTLSPPTQASGSFFAVQILPYTISYTATDDLGNTATCAFTITVSDTTKPKLTNCPLPMIKVLPVDSCTVTLTWAPPTVTDNCTNGLTLSSNLQPGIFTTGDTMVVYTATDASGNTSTCAFVVSVSDIVPPVIDCPTTPIPVLVPSPCGVVPVWSLPPATDNCTPVDELVYTSSYVPGDTFPSGTTTFVVRVTDAGGKFAECALKVENNITPRFINIPDTIFVNMCDAHVTWDPPVAVDFCPPVLISVSPLQPGSIFPFGATTVTYTASDTLGNSATATFVVVVSETIAPVFTCPVSPIVVNLGGVVISDLNQPPFLTSIDTAAGCRGVELGFNIPAATDNCVTPTVTQIEGPLSGATFPQGFNNLIFRAVDSSGNQSQCAVFIEVKALGDLAPVVSPTPGCAGDPVTITATNIPGAIYTWVGPGTSSTNVLTINALSAQNDGPYIVTANINGCLTEPDTAIVYMTVAPMAENDLTYTLDPGQTVTFPSVLTNDFLSPAFDFEICEVSALNGLVMNNGDGTFSYTAGDQPGMVSFIYKVCSKTCLLDDQAAVTITVNDTECSFIPNIITPNGDDTNDWFTIPCLDTGRFQENSLVVYNQWGDRVYEAAPYSNNPSEAWRGTLDGQAGKDLPDGVYYYIFKPGPSAPSKKGFVEIFR